MSADIVLFVLGGVTLIVVLLMDALGALGVFGALRFTSCAKCDRWTVHGLKATQLICHRCRRGGAVAVGAPHLHRPHFGS
ncbi:MAG TPA: hypothetical protein VFN80_02945 [Acidothermaceae bacterium]|jgi:hypothetical protein|nr:hypothetical protein [Acidothermaceae bacterium]